MKIEEVIINEIEQFLALTGMSESKFGLEVVKDNKLIKRLRDGKELYSGTINLIRDYINKNTRQDIQK